jgi:hypothetical protein
MSGSAEFAITIDADTKGEAAPAPPKAGEAPAAGPEGQKPADANPDAKDLPDTTKPGDNPAPME